MIITNANTNDDNGDLNSALIAIKEHSIEQMLLNCRQTDNLRMFEIAKTIPFFPMNVGILEAYEDGELKFSKYWDDLCISFDAQLLLDIEGRWFFYYVEDDYFNNKIAPKLKQISICDQYAQIYYNSSGHPDVCWQLFVDHYQTELTTWTLNTKQWTKLYEEGIDLKPYKSYTFGCDWQMSGQVTVKANSLQEAIDLAQEAPLPDNADYVGDSFYLRDTNGEEIMEADEDLEQEMIKEGWIE